MLIPMRKMNQKSRKRPMQENTIVLNELEAVMFTRGYRKTAHFSLWLPSYIAYGKVVLLLIVEQI